MAWRKLHLLRTFSCFFQKPHGVLSHPVCSLLWLRTDFCRLFKQICHISGLCQNPGIVFRKRKLPDKPFFLFFPQFRLLLSKPSDPCIVNHDRRQIRIREIPVIFSVLFGTHREGTFLIVIPPPCLLNHFFSFFQKFNLPHGLPFNCSRNGLKGVQVLHLCPGAVAFCPCFPDGQVDIRTHGAFFQPAV